MMASRLYFADQKRRRLTRSVQMLHGVLYQVLAGQTVRRSARHLHLNIFSQKVFT